MMNDGIVRLAINEEGFVFDPKTGASFTVNETGQMILGMLMESKEDGTKEKAKEKEEAIASGLCERFDVSVQEAQADVRDFVGQLRLFPLYIGDF